MFKIVSLTLPENMIQEIDAVLFEGNFSSRSEFFRVVVRKWLEESGNGSQMGEEKVVEELGYEFGISPKEIEEIKAKAKLQN